MHSVLGKLYSSFFFQDASKVGGDAGVRRHFGEKKFAGGGREEAVCVRGGAKS